MIYPLLWDSADDLTCLLRLRAATSSHLVQQSLRQEERHRALNAFITLSETQALREAALADQTVGPAESRPLNGIPVAVKDNLCVQGLRMTCGSRLLRDYLPPYDATVVARLKRAGAIILGKTNLDEFAMGSSTTQSAFGPTRNPWDLERSPGGSSGGSAVAVATGMVTAALGSDTGGSVRLPASMTGVIGFKPTYGVLSRYGLTAYASSMDQVGILVRWVKDLPLFLRVLAGSDPADATSCDLPSVPDPNWNDLNLKDATFGVPFALLERHCAPSVQTFFAHQLELLESLGAKVRSVDFPPLMLAAYYTLATAEASSNLARFDGIRFGAQQVEPEEDPVVTSRGKGFGDEVTRRILLGTHVLTAASREATYERARTIRARVTEALEALFTPCDFLLTPTSPAPAFPLEVAADPLQLYEYDQFTVPANLAGLPALSLPMGLVDGLPIGLQLMGPALSEYRLFEAAYVLEQARGDLPCSPLL